MAHQPSLANYGQLKHTARTLNQWDSLRPQIISELTGKQQFDVLTRVYLEDEEWALAWETFPKAEKSYYYSQPLDLTIAEATHHVFPERAIPVYIKYVRKAIANRNRGEYAEAASLLVTVQHIYDELDEIETWEMFIAGIRTEFKNLPALRDELNKAGL